MTTASEDSGMNRALAPLVKADAAARRVVAESPIGGFLEFAREKGVDLWLLSIYLGLAPVYWLPIPVIGGEDNRFPLLIVKTLLIAAGVAISIAGDWMNARFRFPGILLGPLGFFLIFALSLPGVVQAESVGESVRFALDIVFAALFLWCFFNLTRRGPAVFIVFKRAFAILVALSVAAAIVVLADADDLYPHRWDNAFVSGFGDKGSGWAIGLALLMPVALMFITTWEGARERVWIFLRGAAVYAIIASQFISGGRAGLLASFFVMGAFLFSRSHPRHGHIRLGGARSHGGDIREHLMGEIPGASLLPRRIHRRAAQGGRVPRPRRCRSPRRRRPRPFPPRRARRRRRPRRRGHPSLKSKPIPSPPTASQA